MFVCKVNSIYKILLLVSVYWVSSSTMANTYSQVELDQHVAKAKQQYETCSNVMSKMNATDADFDAVNKCARMCSNVYNALRRASISSKPVEKESQISEGIKQCNDFYAKLPAISQQESPPERKAPEDAPKTVDEIVSDLKRFSQEFKAIASQTTKRGTKKTAINNERMCKSYADIILKNGLNASSKNNWSTCYNNLIHTKNVIRNE